MYTNYYSYPNTQSYSRITQLPNTSIDQSDDRLIGGGAIAPFLLGGIAGAALSPYFNRPYPYYPYQQCCPQYPPYPPYPYPYYRY